MDQGFGGTSMDAIAAAADVSKATVYAYFPGKEELFAHVISEANQSRVQALDLADDAIETTLHHAAGEIAQRILSPDTVSMYRIIMSEGRNFPDLGTRFYTAGPAMSIDRLAACLATAMQNGVLRHSPPRVAAAQFIGLIMGDLQLRVLLHVGKPPSKRVRDDIAQQGVSAFMRAYQP